MSREREDYRLNIERLNDLFPDHEMITVTEAMQVFGVKSEKTIKKLIPFNNRRVSKATLARIMSA